MLHIIIVEKVSNVFREKTLTQLILTKTNNLIPEVDLATLSLLLETTVNGF